MYSRGGKVWVGEKGQGLVFLEKDWDGSRLPQDLVEEAGLLGTDFELLNKKERAKLCGYACTEDSIHFRTDLFFTPYSSDSRSVFLAWEGNDWLSSIESIAKWELNKTGPDGYLLKLPMKLFSGLEEFPFKFQSDFQQWIDPPDFIPCQSETIPGVRNFLFSKKRTGRDILRFRVINDANPKSLKKWISHYPQNLGCNKEGNNATFRVFAPRARKVELLLYKDNTICTPKISSMNLMEDGVWECKTKVNPSEKTYHYKVTQPIGIKGSEGFSKTVLDPYAEGSIGREGPGLILNLSNKQFSDSSFSPPHIKDLVIVEAHIRDLLAKAPADLTSDERNEFRGITKWLMSDDCYLRNLGANAIELQPVQQFDSREKKEYHWGYMPVNYFCPSSDYASSPDSAGKEFSEMINAFHKAGMAVILDVVYNHMGIPNHLFNIDRDLYLNTDDLGRLTNHSGCGNDLRCDAGPVKKLIIDSLKYWIQKFDVDGFRFDLGELLGKALLQEIEAELRQIKPEILLIAEPWSFRGRLPTEMNQTGYSLWSDRSRENLLTLVKEGKRLDKIILMMKGKLDSENQFPWQSINYCESHDDYAFIDRICNDIDQGGFTPGHDSICQAKFALTVLLLSPGVPMLSAGQDFLRSKKGIRNTYQNGEINALDYQRLAQFKKFSEEIRTLINFRISKRGLFTRPYSFEECSYEKINCGSSQIISLAIRHLESDEAFLFLGNPNKKSIPIDIPSIWKGSQHVFPKDSSNSNRCHLLPWEFRLLSRKVK